MIYLERVCKKLDDNLKNWLSYGYLTNSTIEFKNKKVGSKAVSGGHFPVDTPFNGGSGGGLKFKKKLPKVS